MEVNTVTSPGIAGLLVCGALGWEHEMFHAYPGFCRDNPLVVLEAATDWMKLFS